MAKKKGTNREDRVFIWIVIGIGLLVGLITLWSLFLRPKTVGAFTGGHVEVCLCHNVNNNPITVCADDSSTLLRGHGLHLLRSSDEWGRCEEPEPTPTPTPEPTPEPRTCETEAWSCEACQNDPNEYEERLGICYKDFVNYCQEAYNCEWVGCDLKTIEVCNPEWVCEDTCEEPEPTPTPTPQPTPEPKKPEGCTENCNPPAPQCSEEMTVKEAANFHVYRNGDEAILRWIPTDGNKVHAYWKNPSATEWEHSTVADNTGSLTISDLGSNDWTFGLSQHNDCGGGVITSGRIVSVVDGDTPTWVLFR